jgi:hypothetical protein
LEDSGKKVRHKGDKMTFPTFWFFLFLDCIGWPRTKGLFFRKQVVSSIVLWGGLVALVRAGIALGTLRPKIAVSLLADLFSERDWSQKPVIELWTHFDPSKQLANNSDKLPEEIIAGGQSPMDFFSNKPEQFDDVLKDAMKDVIEWKFVLSNEFSARYHIVFIKGLIWGLSHPKEALARHEEQRQEDLKYLPDMLSHGLNVQPPETLEEFADSMEESVNAFQEEIRPFAEIPHELLNLPVIATRLNLHIVQNLTSK